MTLACRRAGSRAFVTLAGPHQNAIDIATWRALAETFTALNAEPDLRTIVISGAGGHFAAGADIAEFPAARGTLRDVRHYHEGIIAPALAAIADSPHVVLASIEGSCVGGGLEVAACCDLRYASRSARFGVPIGKLGFALAPDEMAVLLRVAGATLAAELLFEARLLTADEALARRLVTRVCAVEDLGAEVEAALCAIEATAVSAQRLNKRLLRAMRTETLSESERAAAFAYADSPDHHEGVAAFLAGRKPNFNGSGG